MRKFTIIDYVVHSSLLVGIVGVCIILTTFYLLNFPLTFEPLIIIFLVSFSLYNLNRQTDIIEDLISNPKRVQFIKIYSRKLKIISILSYFSALLIAFQKSLEVFLLTLFPAVMVGAYSIPFLPTNWKRLKEIFLVKNLTVAFTWAFGATFLGVTYYKKFKLFPWLAVFIFIFLKVLGNTIVFDIKDIEGDKRRGIITIPIRIGIRKTKILLTFLNISSFFVLFLSTYFGILPTVGYFVSLVIIYTQIYIALIGEKDIKFLTEIMADSEYIFMAIMCIIGDILV